MQNIAIISFFILSKNYLLKALKNLLTDDEARIAYQNYRNRARQLRSAAEARFALQEEILTEVLEWGFADQIWAEVQKRNDAGTGDAREPWFQTNLAKALYNDFRFQKQAEKEAAVEAAVTKAKLDELSAPRVIARIQSDKKAAGSTPDDVANVLANFLRIHKDEADKRWQQETMLRLVSRLIRSDRQMESLKLVAAIKDVQTRELAYELAGQAVSGWRALFFVGILPALLIVPMIIFLREPAAWKQAKEAAQRGEPGHKVGSIADLFRDPRWGRCVWSYLGLGLARLELPLLP